VGNRLGIDPNKFKFLSSDGKSTTLQHKDGHKLTIAHSVLSSGNREALNALSKVSADDRTPDQASEYGKVIKKFDEGGKVPVPDQPNQGEQDKQAMAKGIAEGSQQGTPIPSTDTIIDRLKNAWAEGGEIKKQEMKSQHGGEGHPCPSCNGSGKAKSRKMYADPDQPVSSNDSAPQALTGSPDIGGVQNIAPAMPPMTKKEADNAKMKDAIENYKDAFSKVHEFLFKQPNMEKYYPEQADTQQDQEQPQQAQPQAAQVPDHASTQPSFDANGNPVAPPNIPDNKTDDLPAIDDGKPDQEIQGHTNPAQISHADSPLSPTGEHVAANQTGVPPTGSQQSPAQLAQPTLADHKQAQVNDLTQHAQNLQNDLDKGHITPKTYHDLFHNKSTLGKIGSIFGLLLSGAGSGLAHQPNMAFQMMNNEIQNDLNAQQSSASNKQNLMRINQQGLMNNAHIDSMNTETAIKARALANINANQIALHHLNLLANGQGNSPEMAEAQKAFPGATRQQAQQMLGMVAPMFSTENAKIADLAASKLAYMNAVMGNNGGQGAGNNPAQEIRKKQIMGFISPQQAEQGLKEVGNVENMQDANNKAMGAFDQVSKLMSVPHYVTSPIQNQRRIDAIWDPMIDKVTKTNEGRVTPITVDLLSRWKPKLGDNAATTQFKRTEMGKVLFENMATPTLDSLNVPIHKGPTAAAGAQGGNGYQEGTTAVNKATGQRMILKNGNWIPIGS
jgi:hypothetical protein